tara:strand:+ start:48974 stop:49402 length:429 start_codon:yes stop_codon:yes gene_type:complete
MTRRLDAAGVAMELSATSGLSRSELIARWEKAHRLPPPKGISRRLLEYSAAYQVQMKTFGGLNPATKRKLKQKAKPKSIKKQKPSKALAPGARLVREWQGRNHDVEVVADGFTYQGETYGSLSEVARVITGARWSGPRFFGL